MTITTTMMDEVKKDQILIFPFMAQGHTIPLIHLATFLSTHHHLHVTIITTSANAPSLRRHLPSSVHLSILPFPSSPLLPAGVESTDLLPSFDLHPAFVATTMHLRPHFHHLLHSLHLSNSLPLCLISDFFLPWTLDVCRLFSVPRIVFHGMSTFSMYLCKSIGLYQPHKLAGDQPFHVPGAPVDFRLTLSDVPDDFQNLGDSQNPSVQFLNEVGYSEINSWGVIVNSFAALEGEYPRLLESMYVAGARSWLVGPLSLLKNNEDDDDDDECLEWLNGKPKGSVVYVSFGTQAHIEKEQLVEVAHGLEMAGFQYLWVVRDVTFRPPPELITGKKGKIIAWAPQTSVLSHEAVGGFVSHCGWNSALESIGAGKPVLAWPMIAEQKLNAKFLVEELGVGMRINDKGGVVLIRREEIEKGVREMMVNGEIREKVEMFGRMARNAVGAGGSSYETLNELLQELRRVPAGSNNGVSGDHRIEMKEEMVVQIED